MLDKTYQPDHIETRHYNKWEEIGAFKAGAGLTEAEKANADSFCIVLPPPKCNRFIAYGACA